LRRLFQLLKPLGDRVIIEIVEAEEKTASGIVLPDSAQEKPQQGRVIAVSEKTNFDLKEGDNIIFSKFAGTEVKHEGKEYLILRETDILAVID